MKYEKILTISLLPLMWLFYCIFEIITGRLTNPVVIIGNIFLILLFALVGYFLYTLSHQYKHGFSFNQFLKMFIILMLVDQGIKIIIKSFFFNDHIELINDFLYFYPIINTQGSWINARFNTGISYSFLIVLNIVALFLFVEIYRYYLYKNNNNKSFYEDMCFLFIFCGAFCSLLDKLFFGGSLDFIGIGDLFVADFKDMYINLGLLFFIISLYRNGILSSDESSSIKDDLNSLKDFFIFVKKHIFK